MNDFENEVKKVLNHRVDEHVGPRRAPPDFDATRSATRRSGGAIGSRWLRPLLAAAAVVAVAIGATLVVNDMSHTYRGAAAVPGPLQTATASPTHTDTIGPTAPASTGPTLAATTRPLPTATSRPTSTVTTEPVPTAAPTSSARPTTPAATPSPTLTSGLPGAPPCEAYVPGLNVPGIRPATIFMGCATSADMLEKISWSSWTTTGATGTATHGINDCKPSCARGTYTYFPVNVRLSQPARWKEMLIFETIAITPTSSVGRPEAVTTHSPYGLWGWTH